MGYIAHLPEEVSNSLRSSIVLADLAQIVEELICNSVDAGATKVQAFVDVGTCYIKVEDDGYGIKRDDLTLLGERHATSKLHTLAELNAGIKTLGFRGEALSSLSDVALLEVTTRARGNPNSYRKIIKSCKCLSLGLSSCKQAPGTTVIARDIFYNQPVRRRHFQSSPKKVLQSVRERVLRIALIHPKVSFTVTDSDGEEKLIQTVPASSPLCILSTTFGNELLSDLHKIDFAKGKLSLSGFVSRPPHPLSSKAVQFFYINSRFVHKTPVHKLLNGSSTRFDSVLTPSNGDPVDLKRGKKYPGKVWCEKHSYPAYVLNLICPPSSYDITLELSKTMVEFKNWAPVISFVDEALQHTWGQLPAHSSHGPSKIIISPINVNSTPRKRKIWQHIDPTYHPSCKTEASSPSKEDSGLSAQVQRYTRRRGKVLEEPFRDIAHELVPHKDEQRSEDTLLSFSFLENVSGLSCDAVRCHPQETEGFTEIECSTKQMSKFNVGEGKDKESNEILGIEWANNAPGIDLQIPGERKPLKSNAISDLLQFDNKEAQFSFLSSSPTRRDSCMFSEHLPAGRMSDDVLLPVVSYKNPLRGEVDSFELENGKLRNTLKSYCPRKLSHRGDDYFSKNSLLPDRMPYTSSSPVINDKSLLNRKWDSLKQQNNDPSNCDEMDWPRNLGHIGTIQIEECSQNNCLISEDVFQSVNTYSSKFQNNRSFSELESFNPNVGIHSGRHRSVPLDHEATSHPFMCKNDQQARNAERALFSSMSDNLVRDTGHDLCFGDGLSSHQSKFEKHVFMGRQKEAQIHEGQSYASLPKQSRHFDSLGYLIDHFHLDHPCSKELGEMSPTVSLQGNPEGNDQNELGFRWDRELKNKKFCTNYQKANSRRSLSAPPLYRRQQKFGLHINPSCSLSTIKRNEKGLYDCSELRGSLVRKNDVKVQPQFDPAGECFLPSDFQSGLQSFSRECLETSQLHRDVQREIEIAGDFARSKPLLLLDKSNSPQENNVPMSKWITNEVLPSPVPKTFIESPGYLPMASRLEDWRKSCLRLDCQDDILDLSSGALYLANSSLVPESINKDCLKKARVLQQIDKKFIAVIAEGNLALIDQHAADERIRLEQLRKEVLEGEGRQKFTFLEHEEELVLPMGGLQLLQTYSKQIEYWGWRCKILSRNERTLKRKAHQLHRSSCTAILSAVPCILGVNLTAKHLTEYLEQLAQTGGSSAAPPAVLHILSFKACRGSIMFGDSLLQSECALLVEELKRTALCFHCAHGRPTTVPIVNLEALHRQVAKFGKSTHGSDRMLDGSKATSDNAAQNPSERWHGLQRHRATLERVKTRLN